MGININMLQQLLEDARKILGDRISSDIFEGKTDQKALESLVRELIRTVEKRNSELKKLSEEYNNLFQYAPCYITIQDRDFRLIRFNRDFHRQFGAKEGDFCYHAYKGRTTRCKKCPVVKTFEDGQTHFSEERGIAKDGTESYWLVRTAPIRDESGKVVAAMEMCVDVTETKYLEEEIRKSEKKYRTFFNTIPNPVFVLDQETLRILDCNNSVVDVYGYHKDELLGKSFLELCEKHSCERFAREIKNSNVLNQRKQIRKDGKVIYVNIRISKFEYFERDVLLVTTSDITKWLEAKQQLIQAGKMATLGEMATGVAHELNQPLTVIKTASSFLRKKTLNNEKIPDTVLETIATEIDAQVNRATRIINHMREFGRKSGVKKSPIQINVALKSALEFFNQQLKVHGIEVIENLDPDLPLILADSNRLEQVFINLLINARDAIEEKLESGTCTEDTKEIKITTSAKHGDVVVEIEDTGAGIEAPILNRIFEPFFTTKKVGKGTGLGLSISYGIVQDYGGKINVETEEGKGTRFIITFPIPDEG